MITNKWIMGDNGIEDAHFIRREVFVNEQNVPLDEEMDDLDARSLHLIIYSDEKPVATARMCFDGDYHIGRVAVLKEYRGLGVGDFVMRLMLFKAFDQDASRVSVNARLSAEGFYKKYGFVRDGAEFTEGGAPHVRMIVTPETVRLESKCSRCADRDKCGGKC